MPETKGITIEFYGKTIDLQNKIDDVNKGLKLTRAELNDFKRQLKIDPNNLDALQNKFKALKQEQTLLNKSIELYREELGKLDDKDIGTDKWNKFQTELKRAETQLLGVTKELDRMNADNINDVANAGDRMADSFDSAGASVLSLGDLIWANILSDAIKEGISFLVGQLKQIPGELHQWAEAYREADVYEKQFESNIRNTADATDEQIDALKKLAKQKQREGVISSKAITSAYQELATYVESTDAISGLTDALVDMSAQQYGVDASADSVRNLATTLGKALANGDYSGLTRLGYGFDDAQKYIMKYGDELERVAVLNEVIESSIGGMNEALALTDSGQLFQASEYINDIKEQIGAIISELEVSFVQEIFPMLQEISENILTWLYDHKDEFVQFVQEIVEWLTSDEVKQWFADLGQMVEDLWETVQALKDIFTQTGIVSGAVWALGEAIEFVRDLVVSVRDTLRTIRDEGLFNWAIGNYNSYDWGGGGDSFTPGWSGGYGALNSGGYNLSLNANFTVNSNNVTRADVKNWASWLADDINNELGRRIR